MLSNRGRFLSWRRSYVSIGARAQLISPVIENADFSLSETQYSEMLDVLDGLTLLEKRWKVRCSIYMPAEVW